MFDKSDSRSLIISICIILLTAIIINFLSTTVYFDNILKIIASLMDFKNLWILMLLVIIISLIFVYIAGYLVRIGFKKTGEFIFKTSLLTAIVSLSLGTPSMLGYKSKYYVQENTTKTIESSHLIVAKDINKN